MQVKDLIKLLKGVDPEMKVLMPVSGEFDGFFHSPCKEESGVGEMGLDEDSDETEKSFMIVPCGFFHEHTGPEPELN